jgi:exodeoxyribonuclease VII large subunit
VSKRAKSQWDFGELFPPEQLRKVLSVTELTWQIKRLLEQQVSEVWVTGEVTNLRLQSSGHIYFTLKDAAAQLSCVLFRSEAKVERSALQDGRKVTLHGQVTVYEPRGQYQLRVTQVDIEGVGALQIAFEKLKQKLKAEGLFAQERKRALPRYPRCIGLVTSPTGAAIRDVIHVVERRNPALEIILAPCRVQGEGAAEEIAAAIGLLNEFNTAHLAEGNRQPAIDLILLTRGGGSLEDLWAFNEEAVARAIFHSALPVVSAVGHEIDFTISDFVADLRAATPSAAAEIITEGVFASGEFIAQAGQRLRQLVRAQIEDKQYEMTQAVLRLARVHPRRRVNDWLQRLDEAQTDLSRCAQQGVRSHRLTWQNLLDRLARVRPFLALRDRLEILIQTEGRLHEQVRRELERWKNAVEALEGRLRLLGPEQVLARGYSITTDAASGKVLRAAAEVRPGLRLRTRLKAGEVLSKVEK